jgi:hypothetical protein
MRLQTNKCSKCNIKPSLVTIKMGFFRSNRQAWQCMQCGKIGSGASFGVRGAIHYITDSWNMLNTVRKSKPKTTKRKKQSCARAKS